MSLDPKLQSELIAIGLNVIFILILFKIINIVDKKIRTKIQTQESNSPLLRFMPIIILMLLSLEGEQGLFSLSLKMRQYLLSRQGLVFVIFMSTRMLIYRWLLKLRKMPNCSVHPYVMR